MRETVYYQRHAPDPILDESLVLQLARQHVPQAKALRYIDESGGEARMYAIDENIILKVQRPQQLRSSTSLEKEVFFLQQLEAHSKVSVPRVLGYEKNHDLEYICMTRMPGTAAEHVKFSKAEKRAFLLHLGKELRHIHNLDQQPFLQSGLFPSDEPDDVKERLRRRYLNALRKKTTLRSETFTQAQEVLEQELQHLPQAGDFVALHVNPYIPHVFVDELTHQYTGIIDFGDSYIGHPIFDMWYWSIPSRTLLLKGYIADQPINEMFLATLHSLNRVSEVMKPYLQ